MFNEMAMLHGGIFISPFAKLHAIRGFSRPSLGLA
jgi:hypothetical protein